MWSSTPSPTRRRALRALAAGGLLALGGEAARANGQSGSSGNTGNSGHSGHSGHAGHGGHGATAGAASAAHPQFPGSRLRGQAKLRWLGLGIYQAQLWTQPGFRADQPLEQPVLLQLTYLREFEGAAIAQRSLEEMRRAGPLAEAQAQRWLANMERLFPDVRVGDRLAGLHTPGQGARFWHDSRPLGEIADAEFARRFFGIWLAPTTSQPGLRLSLLGLGAAGSL